TLRGGTAASPRCATPGGPAGLLSAPGARSPAEGRVCVQRPGVSLLHSVSGRSADAALGGGLGAPQLVLAAHRIRTGRRLAGSGGGSGGGHQGGPVQGVAASAGGSRTPASSGGLPGFLEQHLLLVYTGKTRLARNLLQDVGPELVQSSARHRPECLRPGGHLGGLRQGLRGRLPPQTGGVSGPLLEAEEGDGSRL
ncbi:unnamed protein product, partial [Tetraodon nigroviridis]